MENDNAQLYFEGLQDALKLAMAVAKQAKAESSALDAISACGRIEIALEGFVLDPDYLIRTLATFDSVEVPSDETPEWLR